jgi:hypothetical protein
MKPAVTGLALYEIMIQSTERVGLVILEVEKMAF